MIRTFKGPKPLDIMYFTPLQKRMQEKAQRDTEGDPGSPLRPAPETSPITTAGPGCRTVAGGWSPEV